MLLLGRKRVAGRFCIQVALIVEMLAVENELPLGATNVIFTLIFLFAAFLCGILWIAISGHTLVHQLLLNVIS